MHTRTTLVSALLTASLAACFASGANAQHAAAPAAGSAAESPSVIADPRAVALGKLTRPLPVTFDNTRLEDALKFITTATGVSMDILWSDEHESVGLDKEATVSLRSERASALTVLENVLKAVTAAGDTAGNTWQFTSEGTLQVGPKLRLNKYHKLVIYPMDDLLLEIKDKTDYPRFDLSQALQVGSGGSGPFQNSPQQNQNEDKGKKRDDQMKEIQRLLMSLVEPEQWADNGGDGASIRFWRGSFLIDAPDYIHRQINGYDFWPAGATKIATANGRRYVTLNAVTQNSTLKNVRQVPVQAVVGGQVISSGGGGGKSGGSGGGGSGGGGGGGGTPK